MSNGSDASEQLSFNSSRNPSLNLTNDIYTFNSDGNSDGNSGQSSSRNEDGNEDGVTKEENLENDDPLSIKQLALNFDYLVYKINDKIKSLSELTYDSIVNKQEDCHDFLIDINDKIKKLKQVLENCDALEKEFLKLEQIGYIISEFKGRITSLEKELGGINV